MAKRAKAHGERRKSKRNLWVEGRGELATNLNPKHKQERKLKSGAAPRERDLPENFGARGKKLRELLREFRGGESYLTKDTSKTRQIGGCANNERS